MCNLFTVLDSHAHGVDFKIVIGEHHAQISKCFDQSELGELAPCSGNEEKRTILGPHEVFALNLCEHLSLHSECGCCFINVDFQLHLFNQIQHSSNSSQKLLKSGRRIEGPVNADVISIHSDAI